MPDCEDGDEECLARIKEEQADCETTAPITESYCEPAPCETDADCGDGMVCIEYEEEWCSGSAAVDCDDEGNCAEVIEEEPVCGSDVYKECTHRYELACEQDADCGEGFNCVPSEICSCGAGTGDMDGEVSEDTAGPDEEERPAQPEGLDTGMEEPVGDEIIPVAPDCTCEPTGQNRCELQEIDCITDADCPAGMICDSVQDTVCLADETGEASCDKDEAISQCRPEDWYGDDAAAGDIDVMKDDSGEEAPENGDENDGNTGEEGEVIGDGNEADNTDPTADNDEIAPSDADETGDEITEGDKDEPKTEASPDGATAGGCSVVTPAVGGSSAGTVLGLLSLLAFAWRRRRN
jgi:MYXO-CTERM domain-containing protein